MAVAIGDIVLYVTKVQANRKDRRGFGVVGSPDVPANYGRLASIVQRVLSGNRLGLLVLGEPPFGVVASAFNPALPHYGTWEPKPPGV